MNRRLTKIIYNFSAKEMLEPWEPRMYNLLFGPGKPPLSLTKLNNEETKN